EIMMAGILFPMRRLAAAGNDDAMAQAFSTFRQGNGGGQVHVQGHRADNAIRAVHQTNQVAQLRFATHIEHASERRMIMSFVADLDEEEPVAEGIDDLLPSATMPPFDRVIILATGGDNPVGTGLAENFLNGTAVSFFLFAEMNVAFELGGPNLQA